MYTYFFIILICISLFLYYKSNEQIENFKVINKLKIVVTSYNPTPDYLIKCLKSIENQTYKYFNLCILDDNSDDKYSNEYKNIITSYSDKYNWKYIFNKKNEGPLVARSQCINLLKPDDEDIIVLIDGDDELYNENVLENLNNYYQGDTLITFGNFYNKIDDEIIPIPRYNCFKNNKKFKKIIKNNSFRKRWIYSHLKTFKFKLYKNINDKDLRDSNNEYINQPDLAMYP